MVAHISEAIDWESYQRTRLASQFVRENTPVLVNKLGISKHRCGHGLSDCQFTYATAVPGGVAASAIGWTRKCLRHTKL